MKSLKEIYTILKENVSTTGISFKPDEFAVLNGGSKKSQFYVSYAQLQQLFGEPNIESDEGLEYGFSADTDPESDDVIFDVALYLSYGHQLTPDEATEKLPWSIISRDWNSAYEFSQWLQQQLK